MFGFLRKTAANTEVKRDFPSAHLQSPPLPRRGLGEDDFYLLLNAFFRSGDYAAIYYAKCFGKNVDTLDYEGFLALHQGIMLHEPDEVTDHGMQSGFDYFEKEIYSCLYSQYMDIMLGLENLDSRNPHMTAADVDQLHRVARELKLKMRLKPHFPDIDLARITFDYVAALRLQEIEMMAFEIRERTKHIKKIFGPLRNSRTNKYGDEDFDPEFDELDEFIKYAFRPEAFRFFATFKPTSLLLGIIDEMFEGTPSLDDMPGDGIEFEHWCADLIRHQGWSVEVSKASGDQGVDIMAHRDGLSVAIQCKRYSKPIGNKAVQEVLAGSQFQDAGHSCVIGTGGFTPAAREIAAKTGVHLLDASNIEMFSDLFGLEPAATQNLSIASSTNGTNEEFAALDTFELVGQGGGLIGILLRSMVQTIPPDELDVPPEIVSQVLSNLDESTGQGILELDQSNIALTLIMVLFFLRSELPINEENADILRESDHYDSDLLEASRGTVVAIQEFLDPVAVARAYEVVQEKLADLSSIHQSAFHQSVPDGYLMH